MRMYKQRKEDEIREKSAKRSITMLSRALSSRYLAAGNIETVRSGEAIRQSGET